MARARSRLSGVCLALASAFAAFMPLAAAAQASTETFDTSAGNLLVVLRESRGENKQDETLEPYGRIKVRLENGRDVEFVTSWYQYLGDMHVRIVFDGPQNLQSAAPEDLERLRLTPEEALEVGIANLRRVYGSPTVKPWTGGLMQVEGGAPDLASSYFLDRKFWAGLQRQHPDGIVAAVPRRGGLVFAPMSDRAALATLQFSAAALYAGGPGTRLSSALYLFKDGRWSVFQPPQAH
ncbi:MAG TPA: hypothetical protein VK996_14330 [Ramlibacter sp.]|nr:hypothetical protein [Ramlibacter sp.]